MGFLELLNDIPKLKLPTAPMDHSHESIGRPGEQLESGLFRESFPSLEHHVSCIPILDVLKHDQIIGKLGSEVPSEPTPPVDKTER